MLHGQNIGQHVDRAVRICQRVVVQIVDNVVRFAAIADIHDARAEEVGQRDLTFREAIIHHQRAVATHTIPRDVIQVQRVRDVINLAVAVMVVRAAKLVGGKVPALEVALGENP